MKLKAIFFDFDGVIMDSMHLKLEGYCRALAQFNFPRDQMDRIMCENMGTSRQKIIVEMYQQLSGKTITDDIFEPALATFNKLDEEARPKMVMMAGSLDFLKKIHLDYYTAVVTGTPEDVVLRTTAYHKLDSYFDIVRGSPETKADIISGLMKDNQFKIEECIFIGDGKADQNAAAACDIRFVGMNCHGASFNHEKAWRVIKDLHELLPLSSV